ncbi:MAG: hypothetical protein ACLTYN_04625 [Dysosmobacter welbionis]
MLVDKLCYNFRSAKDLLTEKQYALCEYAWYVTKHADEIDETQIENLRKRASTTTRSWRPPCGPASSTTPTAGFYHRPSGYPVTSATTTSRADPWRTKFRTWPHRRPHHPESGRHVPMGTDLADIRGNATPRLIAYTPSGPRVASAIINEYTGVDDVDSSPPSTTCGWPRTTTSRRRRS